MNIKTWRWSPVALGVAACLVTGGAGAALYGFGPAESWTIEQLTDLSTSVSSNIASFGTSFSTNMVTKYEQVISAIAVATKQEALGGNVVSDGAQDAAAQLVNAIRAQRESEQVATAYMDYNGSTGQGYEPCNNQAQNRTLDAAFKSLRTTAQTSVASLDVAPGRMVPSTSAAMAQRLAEHRQRFCTQAEAAAGLCTLSDLPGGDTNGALLFLPTQPGSLQQAAQHAYIQHVLGSPDPMLQPDAGRSAAGQQYMVLKNNKDALLSIPAYSLAMVQAANTKSPDLSDKSPNEVLTLRVNQYFGGKEAQKWSGVLTAQSERGLMVEAVKMGGLEAWLRFQQYQQNQRLELNLAALALAASERTKGEVDAKYAKLTRDTATGAIK